MTITADINPLRQLSNTIMSMIVRILIFSITSANNGVEACRYRYVTAITSRFFKSFDVAPDGGNFRYLAGGMLCPRIINRLWPQSKLCSGRETC